jgi:N-acetylmuramoyl-L-alanine amidase
MSYPIKQDLIQGLPQKPFRGGIGAYEGVVNHSTDSMNASAEAEDSYFHREWRNRQAFVHFFVDWDSIIQTASTDYTAWGAGGVANQRYIHIELCETDDPAKFKESYDRYVWLTAKLLFDRRLGVKDAGTLWSHAEVSNILGGGTDHQDPLDYLKSHGISWSQHVANVQAAYNAIANPPAKSVQQATPAKSAQIGVAKIVCDTLNVRTGAGTNFPIVKDAKGNLLQLHRGGTFKVYAIQNGWYNVGAGWISGNPDYVTFTKI